MRIKLKSTKCVACAALVLPAICMAEPIQEDFFSMSLRELLDVEVTVSSKRDEAISSAPGVISVISKEEIAAYGARNLHDVMRLVPGVQGINPQYTHNSAVAVRGQISGATDKYFLILLNGKPIRDPMLYGINSVVYDGIPLQSIERLEIIRGPGSVIYGSNAIAGVMNIVTTSVETGTHLKLSSQAGSFDTQVFELELSSTFANNGYIRAALRNLHSDGWSLRHTDPSGSESDFRNERESFGAFIDFRYKDFGVMFFKGTVDEKATLASGLIADATNRPSDRTYLSADYKTQLNEYWTVGGFLTTDMSDKAATTAYDASDVTAELMVSRNENGVNIDVGANVRRNKLVDTQGVTVSDLMYQTVFAQLDYPYMDKHKVVTGLQAHHPEASSTHVSPRLAFIGDFTDSVQYKLMYGEAFSSPTGVEFSLEVPGLFVANPDLQSTIVESYDAQISYTSDTWFTSLNVFYSTINNPIALESVSPQVVFPKQFKNLAEEHYQGAEVEVKYNPSKIWKVNASYTYHYTSSSSGSQSASLLSEHIAKLGVIYKPRQNLTLAAFNVFYSAPDKRPNEVNVFNPSASSFSHLTFNANYSVFSNAEGNELDVFLHVDNVLNNSPEFLPDLIVDSVNTQPKIPERSLYLGFRLSI